MRTRFKLPLVGLPTCYYDFPKDDAGKVVKGHRGALRRLLEMELASARCEFNRIKGYYDELDMTDDLYPAGVTICVVGALGRGDTRLFAQILRDLKVSPEAAAKVRKMAPGFFQNLIRFHNLFTGEAATTELTPREFYIAQQLCDGRSYKEIAAKLDVSPGRVNNVVMEIYSKLHIHGKGQLRKFVW